MPKYDSMIVCSLCRLYERVGLGRAGPAEGTYYQTITLRDAVEGNLNACPGDIYTSTGQPELGHPVQALQCRTGGPSGNS
jgi:hypothetical protein